MGYSNKDIILLTLFIWAAHFMVDLMIGLWSIHKTMASLDLALAGLIGGACAFGGEGMQMVFGSLSDKGYKKLLVLVGVVATSASAWFVYTEQYLTLFFLYLVTCLGSGAFHPAAVSALADMGSRQGLLIGLFTSGGTLGLALSQILYRKAHVWFNGQVHWLAIPILLLIMTAPFVPFKKSVSSSAAHAIGFKTVLRFFRQREFRMLYICQVSIASLLWGTMFLLPDLLLSREYAPWLSLGWGHLVYLISGAIMMVPAGYLADRYSNRAVILAAAAAGMLSFYLIIFQPYLEEWTLLLLLCATGAALGVVNPAAVALGTRLAPNQKGAAGAFSMGLVWCVSEGIGLGLGGFLATCFMEDGPARALSILGSLFLVSIFAAYCLPLKEEPLGSVYE